MSEMIQSYSIGVAIILPTKGFIFFELKISLTSALTFFN